MQYFASKKEFKKLLNQIKKRRSFIENIFSIKNHMKDAIKYKAITILGLTFLIKSKKKSNR